MTGTEGRATAEASMSLSPEDVLTATTTSFGPMTPARASRAITGTFTAAAASTKEALAAGDQRPSPQDRVVVRYRDRAPARATQRRDPLVGADRRGG
jgi:hypothetical protein